MSIVSSTHVVDREQVDGRCYVTEFHTDSIGVVHRRDYLAAVGADYVAIRTAAAVELANTLADQEAASIIGDS
jgi:hypothetical protein